MNGCPALASAAELASETEAPVHMHLLETPYQKAYAQKRTGGSALDYLYKFGLTGPQLTIGYGVWMTEADIELCAHTKTRICHNCSSNFRLKSGLAPVNRFIEKGIPVALGIDEAGLNDDRDMLQEMRLVLNVHREPGIESPFPRATEVLRMASEHGADTTSFGDRVGRIKLGCAADIVLIDWNKTTWPYQNPDVGVLDVIVRRARRDCVDAVLIDGNVVYEKGLFTRLDRDETMQEIARQMGLPLTDAERQRRNLATGVMPFVSMKAISRAHQTPCHPEN